MVPFEASIFTQVVHPMMMAVDMIQEIETMPDMGQAVYKINDEGPQ